MPSDPVIKVFTRLLVTPVFKLCCCCHPVTHSPGRDYKLICQFTLHRHSPLFYQEAGPEELCCADTGESAKWLKVTEGDQHLICK